ncbi:MAG: hypothetical protein L0Y56_06640 [Nitrospira sp.]|nr:hypothetical protein [Nitrospira sp.]
MKIPPTDTDTVFEELLQDLPKDIQQKAREFRAFVRGRKVKTPAQLLRLVFLYCGLDKTLRETACIFTRLEERITDQSVKERLQACGPWLKAMLAKMLETPSLGELPKGRRFLLIDGSEVHGVGAKGVNIVFIYV